MINYEKIKNMSILEMAEFFSKCEPCPEAEMCVGCTGCWLNWLNSEVDQKQIII